MTEKPGFIITIDTEGDNLWARPEKVTTNNAKYLPRFQELCEKYRLKPTYLTNYEMANSSRFQEFGKDIIKRNSGEIGMHLHAWDMPPSFELTNDDSHFHPYLIEYPEKIIREKIKFMTDMLENIFQKKMVSHRAGRWSFNKTYAGILVEHGYKIDCSVTPLVSWQEQLGDPNRNGGTDYSKFPSEPYYINMSDISLSGNSPLLELPMSIFKLSPPFINMLRNVFRKIVPVRKLINYFYEEVTWLRPKTDNLRHIKKVLDHAIRNNIQYIEFMLHSSELMPGGSPSFKTEKSISMLYDNMERLFDAALNSFEGCTMLEFYNQYSGKS